jgi:hypothetical protein
VRPVVVGEDEVEEDEKEFEDERFFPHPWKAAVVDLNCGFNQQRDNEDCASDELDASGMLATAASFTEVVETSTNRRWEWVMCPLYEEALLKKFFAVIRTPDCFDLPLPSRKEDEEVVKWERPARPTVWGRE